MSELINTNDNHATIHWKLLTGASVLALTAYVSSAQFARAEDMSQLQVWIELGGQFEQIKTAQDVFTPPAFTPQPTFTTFTSASIQKPLDFSFGADGKIAFQPENSDWIFSAAIRYGRSNGHKHVHQSTTPGPAPKYINGNLVGHLGTPQYAKFVDAVVHKSQHYDILDFQAGKDVGLGLFGKDSHSVVSLGVRFAQFDDGLRNSLGLDPNNVYFQTLQQSANLVLKRLVPNPHVYLAEIHSERDFQGIGPTLSWSGSTPFAGNLNGVELTLDWGVNGAILFGRQKASVHHHRTGYDHPNGSGPFKNLMYQYSSSPPSRSRSVTVPNVGALAGFSLKFPNAKVSLGYRADFFFGAIDGGIDARKEENRGFFGPFASISVGLGD